MIKPQLIRSVSIDFFNARNVFNITKIDDVIQIVNDLYEDTVQKIEEHNITQIRDKKWKFPEALEPIQVAQLMNKVFTLRNVITCEDDDEDLGTLAIYIDDKVINLFGQKYEQYRGIYYSNEVFLKKIIRRITSVEKSSYADGVLTFLADEVESVHCTTDPDLIPVGNGIFDYRTKVLNQFSDRYVFLHKSPIPYVKTAKNVVIHNSDDNTDWDYESWVDTLSDDKEVIELLKMFPSFLLRPNLAGKESRALMLYGKAGNNGKSTLISLWRSILGHWWSAVSLSKIMDISNKFSLASLVGCQAILSDESETDFRVNGRATSSTESLKLIISNQQLTVEKKFHDPVPYTFRGFCCFALNDLPRISKSSANGSFFRRQLYIPFTKCFTGVERSYIRDDYLKRDEVLQYIVKVALESNVYELPTPECSKILLDEVRLKNDVVYQFYTELIETYEGSWTLLPFSFLYDLYKNWYVKNNPSGKLIGRNTFNDDLFWVVQKSDKWYCDDKERLIRVTKDNMNGPEPLISEYHLDDWKSKTYKGNDINKICVPVLATKYRGIQRVVTTPDADDGLDS